jgi:hypothetical protein
MLEKDMCNVPDTVLSTLQKDVAAIKTALLGSEYSPDSGLVKELCRTKEEVSRLKDRFNKVIWTGIGVGSGVGFVWYLLTEVVAKILNQ